MTSSEDRYRPTVPSPARIYDYGLGGKDNFAVDREAGVAALRKYPEALDVARENRQFLYRVVRYLAEEAGIRQFLDMGSGLPAQQNVHEVAQRFQPDAGVVYVDNDPVVQAHGEALLVKDGRTTVIMADVTRPRDILAHPDTRRLIDFGEPAAALFLSVPHFFTDDAVVRDMLATVVDALAPGSYLALTQFAAADRRAAAEHSRVATEELGLTWKTRTTEEIGEFVAGLEPVPPGLVDVASWRPDPDQPPLHPVDEPLIPFLGAAARNKRLFEFGGVLRKP